MQKIYTGILLGLLSCSQVFMAEPLHVRELVVKEPSPQKASVNLNQVYAEALKKYLPDAEAYGNKISYVNHETSNTRLPDNSQVSEFTHYGHVLSIGSGAHTSTLVKSFSDQLKKDRLEPLNYFETSSLAAAIDKAKSAGTPKNGLIVENLGKLRDVNQVLKNIRDSRNLRGINVNKVVAALKEAHSASGFTKLVNSTRVGISHAVTAATKFFYRKPAENLVVNDVIFHSVQTRQRSNEQAKAQVEQAAKDQAAREQEEREAPAKAAREQAERAAREQAARVKAAADAQAKAEDDARVRAARLAARAAERDREAALEAERQAARDAVFNDRLPPKPIDWSERANKAVANLGRSLVNLQNFNA